MGWLSNIFQRNVEIELTDKNGRKQTKLVSKRKFDALMSKARAEGKATRLNDACRVHILDTGLMHGIRDEDWVIGERVSRATYERFKDKNGDLFALVSYEKGKPQTYLVQKDTWEQAAKQFSEIDRGAAQAFDKFKRDLLE